VSPVLAASGSERKPNVVLVLMDNFGFGEPGVYGGGEIRGAPTPNIDSIAHEGSQLTNYNVDAECTPSRAALMTGRYAIRIRLRDDAPPQGWGREFESRFPLQNSPIKLKTYRFHPVGLFSYGQDASHTQVTTL
jgi:arylsulfatase A-like enzyme